MAWIPYVVMAGSQLLSANAQKNAAAGATDAQQADTAAGINLMGQEFNTTTQQQTPYRVAGYNALNAALSMDGLPTNPGQVPSYVSNPAMIQQYVPGGGTPPPQSSAAQGMGISRSALNNVDLLNIGGQHKNNGVKGVLDPGNLLGGLAHGGPAMGGHVYRVGENHEETLVMSPGSTGYVIPHAMGKKNNLPGRASGGVVGAMGSNETDPTFGRPPGPLTTPGQYTQTPNDGVHPIDPGFDPHPTPATGSAPGMGLMPNGAPTYQQALANQQGRAQAAATAAAAPAAPYNFRADPGYKFAYDQGLQAVTNNDAANGLLHSTAYMKDATNYGQGMADQEFNTIYNRITGIAGLGESATQTTGAQGGNIASQIAGLYGNLGNATASGAINSGNVSANALNNLGGLYYMYQNQPKQPGTPAVGSTP